MRSSQSLLYFDSFKIEPRYPFGYGLSYTTFDMTSSATVQGDTVRVTTQVTNTGMRAGRAVAQIYVSCPQGRLGKEYQRLAAFSKSSELKPGQSQVLESIFTLQALASYDSEHSQTLLESGEYIVRVGEHSRATQAVAILQLGSDLIISQHQSICPLQLPLELLKTAMPTDCPESDRLLARLGEIEKGVLCVGAGLDIASPQKHWFVLPGAGGYTTSRFEKRDIPSITFCDGPAGLRLFDVSASVGDKVRMVTPVMAFMRLLPLIHTG